MFLSWLEYIILGTSNIYLAVLEHQHRHDFESTCTVKITIFIQKWNIKETAVVILNAQIQFLPQTIHDEYTHIRI